MTLPKTETGIRLLALIQTMDGALIATMPAACRGESCIDLIVELEEKQRRGDESYQRDSD